MERLLLKWGDFHSKWSDFSSNGATSIQNGATSPQMGRLPFKMERLLLKWGDFYLNPETKVPAGKLSNPAGI
ncbi:hypothetical protein QS257_05595 [Terrilactibacillus sp. S3-3]|nr:hypothetical protein QS257_05595 [Terrilactibacillus sp. S3-3]